MTLPDSVLVYEIFIGVYVFTFILSLVCGLRNGFSKAAGFFSLVLFSAFRLASNIMLTDQYYKHYSSVDMVKWGYILHGIGYSFLVTSALSFLAITHARANGLGDATAKGYKRPWALRVLHLVNIGALVLLITGYSKSGDVFDGQHNNARLNSKAHIGDIIYCGITLVLFGYTAMLFPKTMGSDKQILARVFLALVFMAVRVAYTTWHTYQVPFLGVSLWPKVGLDYIPEVLAVLSFVLITFVKREPDHYTSQKQFEFGGQDANFA
ncbi:uncharacterized protein SPSC_04845 [Sporisorium scitamineum]|uniref:DUF7702 domain-containing protein n=2 Tax=Sporisorium scitamineum TaxID=49012 RepID=A0A127ZGC7_9BASI|nr:uncharacterized protein SPSC_04845 [Sporisorium scitamineum]